MGTVLKITKHNNVFRDRQIQKMCTSIKLSNSLSQISAELSFTIPYTTRSGSFLAFNIEIGDKVEFAIDKKTLFLGKVIDVGLKGSAEQLKVTCYDYTWWLCKSNITKNFSGITVRQALANVYTEVGAKFSIDSQLGDNGNIILNNHLVKDKPVSKVLKAIYSEVTKQTGLFYYIHQEPSGNCTITECDRFYSSLTIQAPSGKSSANGNLIDFEINESMENMVTQVAIYSSDGSMLDPNGDAGLIGQNIVRLDGFDYNRYGIVQESLTLEDDEDYTQGKIKADNMLNEKTKPSEVLTVTCIGDINYKVGYGVLVKIPSTAYYDKFMYITSSEWTWNKDGTFISKLELSPSKHQFADSWEDIDSSDSSDFSGSDSSGGSDLWNRIETELKRYLGVPYVWGGKTPSGFDCSGYVAYVFNQFSDELNIKSTSHKLTSYTVTMMNEGENVTKEFPNNLKPGDIIFPHEQHVVVYLGDNKVIHAPKTGDVIKISEIYFDTPTRVIRVIPSSAWSSKSSSNATTTNDGGASSNLIEFIKGWEWFYDTAYDDGYGNITIGYGDTKPDHVKQGTCTKEQATKWLKEDVDQRAKVVKTTLTSMGVSLPQNKFDCLVDMAYNLGTGGFNGTYELIKKGASDSEIVAKLKTYNHAGGGVSAGLTKRCNARAKMWLNGVYDSTH